MAVYATVDDLEDELSGAATPDRPDRLLVLASTTIDSLLAGTVYTVTESGLPDDEADAEKLRRMTVLQALWMADDPEGLKDHYHDMRTASVSVSRRAGRPRYGPRVIEYLAAHGYPGAGWVVRT